MSKPVLLVEGILLLTNKELRDLMDIMVFIDTQPDIRFIRRLRRDREERGRSVESITEQYLSSVRPMHNQFVEPSKQFADVILPGGNCLDVAVDMLAIRLQHVCNGGNTSAEEEAIRLKELKRQKSTNGVLFDENGARIM